MRFNSHVERLAVATVGLVNGLTPGLDGGHEVEAPAGAALLDTVAEAVTGPGYAGRCTPREARALVPWVVRARTVIEHLAAGEESVAAGEVNAMLADSGARPQLDADREGRFRVHFHGPDDSFDRGWAAGIAAGLAMAIGGDVLHRFGVCQAPACDRVWVDFSKNGHRRFCSQRCQGRVKAAAYRSRQGRGRSSAP